MKRKLVLALVAVAAMATGVSRAERIDLDLHDYDDDLMRTLEQTLKYFEPDLLDGNLKTYDDDTQLINYTFGWVKDYFAKKGPDGAKGVAIASLVDSLLPLGVVGYGSGYLTQWTCPELREAGVTEVKHQIAHVRD